MTLCGSILIIYLLFHDVVCLSLPFLSVAEKFVGKFTLVYFF